MVMMMIMMTLSSEALDRNIGSGIGGSVTDRMQEGDSVTHVR